MKHKRKAIKTEHPYLVKLYSKEYSERNSDAQISPFNNLSINSAVVYTLINDCCLRCGSLDQIAALIANANARYGESSRSGRTEIEFSSNSSYSGWLQNLILSSISFCHSSNSCSESLDLNKHSDLCLSISDSMYSGAKNLALSMKNKYEAAESGFIMENFTFASNTSLIISPYLFINFALTSGESLASRDLNASFLTFLPNSTDHSVNSFSSLESSFLRNILNLMASSATSDQFSGNTFISISNSSGILIFNSAILASQNEHNENEYLKLSNKPLGEWIEVRYLKIGDEIAVPDYENCNNGVESDLTNVNNQKEKWNGRVAQWTEPLFDSRRDTGSRQDLGKSRRTHTILNGIDNNNYKNLSVSESNSNYACGAIKWEKIASIKTLEPQHVYDLSIEGTRNFIANDIVAHNTYLMFFLMSKTTSQRHGGMLLIANVLHGF